MGQEIISVSNWTKDSESLLEDVKSVFKQVGYKGDSLPTSVFDVEKPISIVFVGQYSAGKSSIIKALTNIEDIEVGEGIKTLETHVYDWNGIKVVDTPGINTKIRPDHDAISYREITNADLLVYVVTEELFDDFVGQNFRKILLDKDKAAEMILVVNKMADVGNTNENRIVKLKDIEKVTAPYSPLDLRTVFVDAKSYLDSLSEEDPDIAKEFKERSNYDQLVETLNKFVKDKGMSSRLTTTLYKIFDILQEAIIGFQSSTGDDDIDAAEEHMLREKKILLQTAWTIETSIKALYENAASEIRNKGRIIANDIYTYNDENEAETALEDAYNEVNKISEECKKEIVEKLEELTNDFQAQIDEFYNSDFSNQLNFRLYKKKDDNSMINKMLREDWLGKGSSEIIKNTQSAQAVNITESGLKMFSGSNAHQWVIDVGHHFGHSFQPWEAVKWVNKINIVGKALGVFGVVFSLGMQAKKDIDEEKQSKEMRASRERLRASFNDAANGLIDYYNNKMNNWLDENYRTRINQIDDKIADIRASRNNKSEACKLLETTQNKCKQLIEDIHKESI